MSLGVLLFAFVRSATACLPLIGNNRVLLAVSYVLFLFTGFIYSFTEVGGLSWVLLTAPSGKKATATAAMFSARMIGSLLGTPIGGILFDLVGWTWTNLFGTALLLLPLTLFMPVLMEPIPKVQKSEKGKINLYTSPKYLLAQFLSLVAIASMYAYITYLQPWFASVYGLSKSAYGLYFMGLLVTGFALGSGVSVKLDEILGSIPTCAASLLRTFI
jgi:MFS transporter, DHA1 family, inner membrane transport protein